MCTSASRLPRLECLPWAGAPLDPPRDRGGLAAEEERETDALTADIQSAGELRPLVTPLGAVITPPAKTVKPGFLESIILAEGLISNAEREENKDAQIRFFGTRTLCPSTFELIMS